jgi:ribulose-phosphate 3-epimerase
MIEIAGSLWSVDLSRQEEVVARLRLHGLTRLHWDRSDGVFAAPGGFDADLARKLSADGGMAAEAHLMTVDPVGEVDDWTDFCDLVYVHREVPGWRQALDRIERRGSRGGLAISVDTPLSQLPAEVPVLCMSITPGRAGSAFDARVVARVEQLRAASGERRISVDGGVTRSLVETIARAGANGAVVGTDLVAVGGAHRWGDVLGAASGEHFLG